VTLIQRWLLNILLDNILIHRLFDLPGQYFFFPFLISLIWISLQYFNTLFDFQILIHPVSFFFRIFIESYSHFFHFLCDEDSSALGAWLRLTYEKYNWFIFSFRFSDQTIFNFLLSFVIFPFCIFLNIMELGRVYPSWWKEIIVLWKFLLKTLQMHSQRTLPTNIIHAEKVVDFLTWCQTTQKLGRHAAVSPVYVPIIWI